ncbi:MAG: restriction endonuclease [Chitinophagaceae bacterium]|nr:MAG: restriction endonuclease [Chitinophagaceae bacterium]
MRIGQIFRYAAERDSTHPIVDGHPNFFYATASPGQTKATLERGINPAAIVNGPDGVRRPAILLSSSPHKVGSDQTPWQDFFDPDEGHARYYGDAKEAGVDPAMSPGNSALLDAKRLHDAMEPENRRLSPPILLFKRMRVGGVAKGFPAFQGFGIIERAELIAQYDERRGHSFPNFAFDIAILDMSREFESFEWRWITDRRSQHLAVVDTEAFAPAAWRDWCRSGAPSLGRLRRRVTKLRTVPVVDQRTIEGSTEARTISLIYKFYADRKHRFEMLAARIAERILGQEGGKFSFGWITPPSSDGGADFVGRLDLGSGFSKVKQVVFGQAKCELPTGTTSGRDVARTAARLRRGWIGVYVTLGAFSEAVQREVIDDEYPILLVPGRRVAEEVEKATREASCNGVLEYLRTVDDDYERSVINRRPEEILHQ